MLQPMVSSPVELSNREREQYGASIFELDINITFISSVIAGIFSMSSILTGSLATLACHWALDLFTIICRFFW